jgi:hypothetical protein
VGGSRRSKPGYRDTEYRMIPMRRVAAGRAFISSTYRFIDNVYFQYEIGTITEQRLESLLYPIVLNFRRRGRLRVEWEEGEDKLLLSPDLVEYLDSEIYKEELD